MKPTPTPLRYPGGKAWLRNYVESFISFNKLNVDTLIEPYAGSAAMSMGLLQRGIVKQAYISEMDPLIVAFWKTALERNDELVEYVTSFEVNLDYWHLFKKYLDTDEMTKHNELELAGAFLFLNRTNYSGIINAGPLGGKGQKSIYKIDCRFNKTRIVKKISAIAQLEGKLHVVESDGLKFMKKMATASDEGQLFYVDPPYYGAGKILYRHYFDDKNHIELSNFLKSLDLPWLLSYDNAEFIKKLYEGNESSPVYTDYQSGHFKKGVKELLISNRLIPPFAPMVSFEQRNVRNESPSKREIKI